jgi:hypothetical protein
MAEPLSPAERKELRKLLASGDLDTFWHLRAWRLARRYFAWCEAVERDRDQLRREWAELFAGRQRAIAAVEAEREACAEIAEEQPFHPSTHTGTRQRWLREEIASAIRARAGKETP